MWLKRTLVLSELFDFLQSTINWRMPCTALDKTFVLATDYKTASLLGFYHHTLWLKHLKLINTYDKYYECYCYYYYTRSTAYSPGQAGTRKAKTSLDLYQARDDVVLGCSGISWTICKQIFTGRMLFLMPNQQCQSYYKIISGLSVKKVILY